MTTGSDQEPPEGNENATKPSPKPRAGEVAAEATDAATAANDDTASAPEDASTHGESPANSAKADSDTSTARSDTGRGTGSEAGPAGRARRLLRWLATPRTLLPVLLIVVLAACAIYFGLKWRGEQSLTEARDSAVAAARDYATDLSSYDYNNLQGNFAKVTEAATGEFAKQYEQVSQNLTELIKQHQAVSKGTVLAAGAGEVTEDHAMVTLFVDQQITNTNNPQPRIDRNRMQMSLHNEDGRWLIDDVKLL